MHLKSVSLSDELQAIKDYTFISCDALTDVFIPSGINAIGKEAFASCASLLSVHLPETVISIGEDAFSNCSSLMSICIPDSVTSIGATAFFGCSKLTSVVLPAKITVISMGLFDYCCSLQEISIPDTVTSIGLAAFNDCSSMKAVYMSKNVVNLADGVFSGCKELQSIDLPVGLKRIGDYDFQGCANLKYVSLPTSVEKIGTQAFRGCSSIREIVIPASVTSIEQNAYYACTSLNIVKFLGQKPAMDTSPFYFCSNSTTIYYPIKYADGWDNYQYQSKQAYCNVTIDLQDGTPLSVVEVNVTNGHIPQIDNPSEPGRSFLGWFKNQQCTIPWVFSVDTVTDDIALYAGWQINTYTVSFSSQGGTKIADEPADYNTLLVAPTPPTRTGYTFRGWFKDSLCTEGNQWDFDHDTVTGSITLYAGWIADTYIVTFDSQGGSVSPKSITATYSDTYKALPLPGTRTGYTFGGWYTGKYGVGTFITPTTKVTIAGNHTLYAKWTINTYTVTFNSQGGSTVAKKTGTYNNVISAPTPPTRSGYVFLGWYKDSACTKQWNFTADKVTVNITLYAKWVSRIPSGVKAASASYNTVSIRWTAVPQATGYEVYRATNAGGPWALAGTSATAQFQNTNLVTGKAYYYKVRSYQGTGTARTNSGYSGIVSVIPIPAAPTAAAAKYSSTSIKITWSAVAGATGYEVCRSTSATGTYVLIKTTTSLSFINTGLTTGKTYYYKVRAYRLVGTTKVPGNSSKVVYATP